MRRIDLFIGCMVVVLLGLVGDSGAACPDPFCDSVTFTSCPVICPSGDIPFVVTVLDSCGMPVCDMTGTYLDFSNCPVTPCPGLYPNWPLVYPVSCDPATGEHTFQLQMGVPDCFVCSAALYINGVPCKPVRFRFLDQNGSLCVETSDFFANQTCSDYNCDNVTDGADATFLAAHQGHCCQSQPCPAGPAFCDSVVADPCMVICPIGDIVYTVAVKDSCGNPLCLPDLALNFDQCAAEPCPGAHPDWPLVYPDSCNPATGKHYFSIKASSLDCIDCVAFLQLTPGSICKTIKVKFLDINNDNCVTDKDWIDKFCNDYDCSGSITAADFAIHTAHHGHCCDSDPCAPGPPLCDSVVTDDCVLICPTGDITHVVTVKDSCGNPFCDPSAVWMDFSQCEAKPCPGEHPDWPIVYPDSCDPATGNHYFSIKASSLTCSDCRIMLFVNGKLCRFLTGRYLDINNDKCVKPDDWLGKLPCNDYDCDGVITAADQAIHAAHLEHCCSGGDGSLQGHKWNDLDCDGVWDANEPPMAGWTINVYLGGFYVGSVVTNAVGQYDFAGLPPGTYQVWETVQPGWVQTFPPTVFHQVNLPPGGFIGGLDFGNHDTTCADGSIQTPSVVAGTIDNFAGPEPATPGADLIPLLTCPLGSTNQFDQFMEDQCFGHTFTNLYDTAKCCLIGAQLCFRVYASGSIAGTDALYIAENGVFVWGIRMNTLQSIATGGADPSWSTGDTLTMCLDLANLPASGLGITNVLAAVQDGDLDIMFQDDTEVDYLMVRLRLCCDGCCNLKGDVNNDGIVNVGDLTFLVNYLFKGGPKPPCLEEADVNGDGLVNVADLTFLVNYFFKGGPAPKPCP